MSRGGQRSWALALVAAAALAGCSGGGGDVSPSVSASVVAGSSFAEQLRQAEMNGDAGETQLKALRVAAAKRSMSYEELDALVNDTITCFDDDGVDYRRVVDVEVAPGLMLPTYMIGEPIAVGDKCVAKFSGYAELAYQRQPSAIAALDARFEAARPQVLACLREHGYVIDDDATADEIKQAAAEVDVKTTIANPDDDAAVMAGECLRFAK